MENLGSYRNRPDYHIIKERLVEQEQGRRDIGEWQSRHVSYSHRLNKTEFFAYFIRDKSKSL